MSKTDIKCARDYIIAILFVCISCHHLNVSTHLHASAPHRVVKLISTSRSCIPLLNAPPPSARPSSVPLRPITIPRVRKIENRPRGGCHLQPTIIFAPLNREFVKNSSLTTCEESRNFINIQHIDPTFDRRWERWFSMLKLPTVSHKDK